MYVRVRFQAVIDFKQNLQRKKVNTREGKKKKNPDSLGTLEHSRKYTPCQD